MPQMAGRYIHIEKNRIYILHFSQAFNGLAYAKKEGYGGKMPKPNRFLKTAVMAWLSQVLL